MKKQEKIRSEKEIELYRANKRIQGIDEGTSSG